MSSPLFQTARWTATRERILLRDKFTCQQCNCGLTGGRTHPRAAVVHHKTPHHGDPELFWCDDDGLEAVCKRDHDNALQREDAKGYSDRIGVDGMPTDLRHPWRVGKLPRKRGHRHIVRGQ